MDFERTLETQRLRLLRMVAGLVVLVGVLSVGPVSRVFSTSVCGFVGSILSRAEAAARYLVIAKARLMVSRSGMAVNHSLFSESLARVFATDDADVSLSDCRGRLRALRAVLMDVPRHALRLIRRIEKRIRRAARTGPLSPRPDERLAAALRDWRLAALRIERPPDKSLSASLPAPPPPEIRAGGAGGWVRRTSLADKSGLPAVRHCAALASAGLLEVY